MGPAAGGGSVLLLQIFRDGLDLLAVLRVNLLVAGLRLVVVVDVGHLDVEVVNIYDDDVAQKRYEQVNSRYRKEIESVAEELKRK